MVGVSISVKDNDTIRELTVDFAIIDGVGIYSQIAGYCYYKQDLIYVKTKYQKIDKVFDFINSLDFNVKEIQSGTYVSNMESNTANLQYIIDGLKSKPYTNDTWIAGHLSWATDQMTFFITLYDMKSSIYQADWFKTMNDYQFEEYDWSYKYDDPDNDIYGPGHIILFCIPEKTGKHWEEKFLEYDFVRWTEISSTRYIIRK